MISCLIAGFGSGLAACGALFVIVFLKRSIFGGFDFLESDG